MKGGLRILADDLTGALDAAAPFATPEQAVFLSLAGPSPARRQTVSTESRGEPPSAARAAVGAQMGKWGTADETTLWFKKVDSVLRGNPIEESVAMMEAGGFDRCIFAPAFPEMGRVTRDGLHFTSTPSREEVPAPVHDLSAAFAAFGFATGRPGDGRARTWIVDATSQADLDQVVATYRHERGVLWGGSRGLAAALAGTPEQRAFSPVSLVVAGTTHPATRRQMQVLASRAVEPLVIIDPVPQAVNAGETKGGLRRGLEQVASALQPGSTVIVIGGDTLSVVLDWAAPGRVACIGEAAPGLPLTQLKGGRLDGTTLLSKSGGFGDAELLTRLVSRKIEP